MQTLKQFLQNLSYKKDKTIARSAKSLVLAIKKSKVPEKLGFYISDGNCTVCNKIAEDGMGKMIPLKATSSNPFLCQFCYDACTDNARYLSRL